MILIPAIDLLENKAVRLYQGEYGKKTVYSDSPWELVTRFEEAGAELIHLVDLDGARSGSPGNKDPIQKIKNLTKVSLELGGGIRNMDTLSFYDDLGIDRFILGTAAVKDPAFLESALAKYGNARIVVGVDAKDGFVKTQGWETDAGLRYEDFMETLFNTGVRSIIFTDISLDGTLQGPNLQSYDWILRHFDFQLIASGGVSSLEDLRNLQNLGAGGLGSRKMYGAITGKAIYENKIDIKEAVKYCKELGG